MKKYFPIFVLPTAIAFIVGNTVPFIMAFYLSFCSFTTVNDAKFVGLSNYVKAFTDSTFLHAMLFSALFTIVTVILINVFAFLIALALTSKIRGTTIFRTVFIMPNLTVYRSWLYLAALIKWYSCTLAKNINIQFCLWFLGTGYSSLLAAVGICDHLYCRYSKYFQAEMLEAAQVDGANWHQRLFNIIIPSVRPSINHLCILIIDKRFKLFDQNLALQV